ncbi:unnamed protein product, partial [Mesorhabditis belari]|uniref:Uncharacterized protein n=1 Tax=Mesorhabditis belari TaxID=2138241 RepID=A0AAF3EAJ6_9BILA
MTERSLEARQAAEGRQGSAVERLFRSEEIRSAGERHSSNRVESSRSERVVVEGRRRRNSEGSETAHIDFVDDDRMQEETYENSRQHRGAREERYGYRGEDEYVTRAARYGGHTHSQSQNRSRSENMAVDYSHQDFRQSLAAIDAAAREGALSREGVRVRQQGETTVVTEHRDPYSFYWQLDKARRESESPPRLPPHADYVIDEEEIPPHETVPSPQPYESEIVPGVLVESQYSRPLRQPEPEIARPLPPGWEKHEDPSGFSYYWHVDSGTIQREPPRAPPRRRTPTPPPAPPIERHIYSKGVQVDAPTPPPQIIQLPPQQPVIEEHAFKQTTTKRRVERDEESDGETQETAVQQQAPRGKPIRFAVRSLGWTEIAEEELTAERSSRAVNRAIVDLSTGRKDVLDNVSKWGDGRELIMELDDQELSLIDPDSMQVIHSERIQQIRVWGVGRDNGRDFAYVARDRTSRRFLCHVFRCDTPAKTIANTLRDICKRLMLHRRPSSLHAIEAPERRVVRSELTTPIEEPRKVIRCNFLGVTQVPRATGIDILNEAVDRLVSQVRPERWILADVAIAPSSISINEVNGNQIAQCRVRYLSFLGIGQDVKHCAFIMHTSSENFMCYVFHVEPSAAVMAKTIEAACKLRYQKVLDAHSGRLSSGGQAALPMATGMD